MRWGIYALDGFEGAEALRQGFLEVGQQASLRSAFDYGYGQVEAFNAIAVFGLQGKGRRIKDDYEEQGIPVYVVDYGYLKRTNHAHDWRTGHWQISRGGLNNLPRTFDASRFDSLGLSVAEAGGDPNGYVLLCAQTTGDASHSMDEAGLQRWCSEQAKRWPGLMIRPHPLEQHLTYGLPVCPSDSLDEALSGARLMVTGNSNSGHDALMAGVPAVATIPGAAWGDLSGEVLPSMAARLAHFQRCAWGQWTWAEFGRGLPQQFLMNEFDKDH